MSQETLQIAIDEIMNESRAWVVSVVKSLHENRSELMKCVSRRVDKHDSEARNLDLAGEHNLAFEHREIRDELQDLFDEMLVVLASCKTPDQQPTKGEPVR